MHDFAMFALYGIEFFAQPIRYGTLPTISCENGWIVVSAQFRLISSWVVTPP